MFLFKHYCYFYFLFIVEVLGFMIDKKQNPKNPTGFQLNFSSIILAKLCLC